jgi:hypothetical protein
VINAISPLGETKKHEEQASITRKTEKIEKSETFVIIDSYRQFAVCRDSFRNFDPNGTDPKKFSHIH